MIAFPDVDFCHKSELSSEGAHPHSTPGQGGAGNPSPSAELDGGTHVGPYWINIGPDVYK